MKGLVAFYLLFFFRVYLVVFCFKFGFIGRVRGFLELGGRSFLVMNVEGRSVY